MRNNLTLDITTSSRVERRLRSDLSVLKLKEIHAVEFMLYRHQKVVDSPLQYSDLLRDLIRFHGGCDQW